MTEWQEDLKDYAELFIAAHPELKADVESIQVRDHEAGDEVVVLTKSGWHGGALFLFMDRALAKGLNDGDVDPIGEKMRHFIGLLSEGHAAHARQAVAS